MTKRELKAAVRQLRDAERRIRPDAAWVARTRNVLLKEVRRDALKRAPVSFGARIKALILSFIPRPVVDTVRGPVMAALSVFGVVLGGSLASVSAAERSIPGDLLYPVKLATEQARIFMEKEPPNQLKLKVEFVERRGEEIKELAKSDTPKNTARLKEATDSLKQDLDAVKLQLHTVGIESSAPKAVAAAKDLDEKSGRLVQTLKEVKEVVPEEVKSSVTEVQVAAVNAGLKAVQILIDKHDDPGVVEVVSSDDLKRVVSGHVDGLAQGIADSTKKVAEAASAASSSKALALDPISIASASSSAAVQAGLLKEPLDQLKQAQASLEEMRELLDKDQFDMLKDKLGEAARAVTAAEKSVNSVLPSLSAASSSSSASTIDVGSGSSATPVIPAPSSSAMAPAGSAASTASTTGALSGSSTPPTVNQTIRP